MVTVALSRLVSSTSVTVTVPSTVTATSFSMKAVVPPAVVTTGGSLTPTISTSRVTMLLVSAGGGTPSSVTSKLMVRVPAFTALPLPAARVGFIDVFS